MKLVKEKPALLLVDIQKGFENERYWGGNRNNRDVEEKCALLLEEWRKLQLPVIHIMHGSRNPKSPLHPSQPGFELHDSIVPQPGEPVIVKDVNSAFIGTGLEELLKEKNIRTLVIAGLTTKELDKEERKKVQGQLLDIFKSIPSLAIFMLPGGAVLLPIFIKLIPKLLPSAFDDNRVEERR